MFDTGRRDAMRAYGALSRTIVASIRFFWIGSFASAEALVYA
ncbi:MAG: hypothetical protein ABIY55_28750 [Kofleriaceae bacterium]